MAHRAAVDRGRIVTQRMLCRWIDLLPLRQTKIRWSLSGGCDDVPLDQPGLQVLPCEKAELISRSVGDEAGRSAQWCNIIHTSMFWSCRATQVLNGVAGWWALPAADAVSEANSGAVHACAPPESSRHTNNPTYCTDRICCQSKIIACDEDANLRIPMKALEGLGNETISKSSPRKKVISVPPYFQTAALLIWNLLLRIWGCVESKLLCSAAAHVLGSRISETV